MTGASELGDCSCRLVGRGRAGVEQIKAGIEGVPLDGAAVSTDMPGAYVRPLAEAGVRSYERHSSKAAGEADLGMADALHANLETFLKPSDGVSTRRFPRYLAWFRWEEQARRSDDTRLGMVSRQVAEGRTDLRVRAMWDEPQPVFAEYWGDRVWSEVVDLDDLCEPMFVSTVV